MVSLTVLLLLGVKVISALPLNNEFDARDVTVIAPGSNNSVTLSPSNDTITATPTLVPTSTSTTLVIQNSASTFPVIPTATQFTRSKTCLKE